MLNMLFSMLAYIFWAQLVTYKAYNWLTNYIPNLVFIYLFVLYHCLHPLIEDYLMFLYCNERKLNSACCIHVLGSSAYLYIHTSPIYFYKLYRLWPFHISYFIAIIRNEYYSMYTTNKVQYIHNILKSFQ